MFNGILRKAAVTMLMASMMLGAAVPQQVNACEKDTVVHETQDFDGDYAIMPAAYIEPCWVCGSGNIYSNTTSQKYFDHSVLCQHGFSKGTDSVYTVYVTFKYNCDVCGYGWQEQSKTSKTECEGYN